MAADSLKTPRFWTDKEGTAYERVALQVEILGEPFGEQITDGALFPVREQVAFFCESCGAIWARLRIEGVWKRDWRIFTVACSKHHDPWDTAGSLLSGGAEGYLKHLPPAALLREFQLYLSQGDRNEFSNPSDS